MQLIFNIKKLLKNEFEADSDFYYKRVFIYPILITHDRQYDTPGFSDLVSSWFEDELEILAEEKLFIHHIKPLTVINIDSLIYNQICLSENISLHRVINKYHEHIKIDPKKKFSSVEEYKEYRLEKMIPFSWFIDEYFFQIGCREIPPVFQLLKSELFEEENLNDQ